MSFRDIIDQDYAVTILQDQLKSKRINHAYLLLGKDGVGKKTLAFQFARALLCEKEDNDSCDKCINCRRIDHHNHPDVTLISPEEDASSIKIDQIRNLQKEIAYKPYETEHKIYIIDEAEKMSVQAANSLLKTLEEPPAYAVIILLAESTSSLLSTIASRCQHITLSNISQKSIKNYLQNQGIKEDRARLLAGLARGSLGRASEINENEDFLKRRKEILNFLKKIHQSHTITLFSMAEKMQQYHKKGFPLFNLLSDWYRDIMIYKEGNHEQIVNLDYLETFAEQKNIYSIKEILSIIDLLDEYDKYLENNVRADLTIEVLLLKIRAKRI
ncbi:MAG: DNA polymerase III subunit delta' [Halanaerobiales bacterium]